MLDLNEKYTSALKKGDKNAFNAIYNHYKESIYFYVSQVMNNETETEEVMEEVFIHAYKNIASFDMRVSLRTWLFKIAYQQIKFIQNSQKH